VKDRPEVLEGMRRDAACPERAEELRASDRAVEAWERAHPLDLAGGLRFIEALRRRFGDGPVDRTPWRGDDFRL
jgi:hypothetical protein